MTNNKRLDVHDADGLEDAFIESILTAAPEDLRQELLAAGEDPDAYVRTADVVLAEVLAQSSRRKLDDAKKAAATFRASRAENVVPMNREKAETDFRSIVEGRTPAQMMLAARKGTNLSANDAEAIKEALAALDSIEEGDEE
jgi:hypothetical protein